MQPTMDTAGRKPRIGSLSVPARMSKLRAANVHKASRVTAYTAAKYYKRQGKERAMIGVTVTTEAMVGKDRFRHSGGFHQHY
ncbi:hypothetical protein ACQJBY_042469 [Aegilops geniculata]